MWWAWIVMGFTLAILELFIPGGFFLFGLGLGAIATGFFIKTFGIVNQALPWIVFGCIAALVTITLRSIIKLTNKSPEAVPAISSVKIIADIPAGLVGKGEAMGTVWSVQNNTGNILIKDQTVKVSSQSGLTLIVD